MSSIAARDMLVGAFLPEKMRENKIQNPSPGGVEAKITGVGVARGRMPLPRPRGSIQWRLRHQGIVGTGYAEGTPVPERTVKDPLLPEDEVVLLASSYGASINAGAVEEVDDSRVWVTVTVTSGAVTVTVTGAAQEPPAPWTPPASKTLPWVLAATAVRVSVEVELAYIVSPAPVSAGAAAAPSPEDPAGIVANTFYPYVSLQQRLYHGMQNTSKMVCVEVYTIVVVMTVVEEPVPWV